MNFQFDDLTTQNVRKKFTSCIDGFFGFKKLVELFKEKLRIHSLENIESFFDISTQRENYIGIIKFYFPEENPFPGFQIISRIDQKVLEEILIILINLRYSDLQLGLKFEEIYDIKTEINFFTNLAKITQAHSKQEHFLLTKDYKSFIQSLDFKKEYLEFNISKTNMIMIICELFILHFNFEKKIDTKVYMKHKKSFMDFLSFFKDGFFDFLNLDIFYLITQQIMSSNKIDYQEITEIIKNFNVEHYFTSILELKDISNIPGTHSTDVIFNISGFLSQNSNKKLQWKYMQSHLPYLEQVSVNWSASSKNKIYSQIWKKNNNQGRIKSLIGNIKEHVFDQNIFHKSHETAIKTGQHIASLIQAKKLYKDQIMNFMSFSLGTIVTFEFLLKFQEISHRKVGDVLLMGSCVELRHFHKNIHRLIGFRGNVAGKVKIAYSKNDKILCYVFRLVNLENALGYFGTTHKKIAKALKENDHYFSKWKIEKILEYVKSKVEIYDFSNLILGHKDYRKKLYYILKKIDFCSNFKNFLSIEKTQ